MKKILAMLLALCALAAFAQAPSQRLRGTVTSFDGTTLVIAERSGATHTLAMADNFSISEVVPIEASAIKPGSYIGTAAMPAADGTLSALEVLVFPEGARGTGEGHSAWDLQPGSTMTNATVAEVAAVPQGRSVTLRYSQKEGNTATAGTKTVVVADNIPVVTFRPGERSMLVPGAKVLVTAQVRDGKPTAVRALVGKDGFAPPM